MVWFFDGPKEVIKNIPNDKNSAKELVEIADSYVKEHWDDRKYFVGKINMKLDKNLEGKVEIWYKDDRGGSEEVPNILTVKLDTKENKILHLIEQTRDSKIEPGVIHIKNWKIDSDEAFEIAKDAFKNENDFDFTSVTIYGDGNYNGSIEYWDISMYKEQYTKVYDARIDPYTGKVLSKEIK